MQIYKIPFVIIILLFFLNSSIANEFLIMQSTTSTANTGLLDKISEEFKKDTGIELRTVAVGTGQALQNARNGDADIVMVHSKIDEIQFIKDGFGLERIEFMYNDFLLVGPDSGSLKISTKDSITDALKSISENSLMFISRDDLSGTHKKELMLWEMTGIMPFKSNWYIKSGSGMLSTLNIASELNAYLITDRGTWISFDKKKDLKIIYEKDKLLNNPYSIIALNPKKFPHVKYNKAKIFIDWILGDKGHQIINNFKINGQQLFFTYK